MKNVGKGKRFRVEKLLLGVLSSALAIFATMPVSALPLERSHCVIVAGPQGMGAVSSKAIRVLATALRSSGIPRVLKFLTRHQATDEQVRVIVKYSGATAQILDTLAKADQASLAWIRGQVEGLLVKSGGASQVDAAGVAFWVEKILDWGL